MIDGRLVDCMLQKEGGVNLKGKSTLVIKLVFNKKK